jgi:endonuclease/exonuclease/phosphatase family metal-dependent hydrolase
MMPRVRRGLLALFLVIAAGLVVFSAQLGKRSEPPGGAPGASASSKSHDGKGKSGKSNKQKKKNKAKPKAHAVATSPFYSLEACQAYLTAHPRAAQRAPRVGTWNIRWFPLGSPDGKKPERHTDLPWLACTIASLDVDVLAIQEIVQDAPGRQALLDVTSRLDTLTHGKWHADLDDCPGSGRQHVGFLYDQNRVTVSDARNLAALNPGANACDLNLRPGFGMYARFKGGPDLSLVSLHFDSGQTARDYGNRKTSVERIDGAVKELAQAERDSDVMLLGDFNSMGCKDCEPRVDSGGELVAIDAQLGPAELRRVSMPSGHHTCTEYQGNGTSTLDYVLASNTMDELPAATKIELFGPCADLGCKLPYKAEKGQLKVFDNLSDHCPLVVTLAATDDDKPGPAPKGAAAASKAAAPAAGAKAPAAKAPPAAPAAGKPAAAPAP